MVSLQQNCGASRKPRQDPAVVRNEESSRELWVFLAQHGPAWFGRKWLLPGTPGSLRATSVAATVDHSVVGPKRRKLLGKQAPPVPLFLASEEVKVRKPKPKVELRVCTCKMPLAGGGICSHRCEGPSEGRKLSCKRANHLANRHAGEDTSKAGTLAKRIEIIDASPALPSESRSWTCGVPGCSAGLPLFEDSYAGLWARDCAIERHRQTAHPGLTRAQMYASRWADFRKGGQQQLKESKDALRAKLRLRADSRLAANKSKSKRKGRDLCTLRGRLAHVLREGWRWCCFHVFLESGHRAPADMQACDYRLLVCSMLGKSFTIPQAR